MIEPSIRGGRQPDRAYRMASVTREAGAVPQGHGSGSPFTVSPLPALVGAAAGRPAASVAMRLERGRELYHLVLLGPEGDALMAFGSYGEDDVVAEWRSLGAATGLELKIQLPNGSIMTPYPQLGRVLLGASRQRRRHGLLANRRPRFLTRRKVGRFALRPVIHQEDEMMDWELKVLASMGEGQGSHEV